MFARAHHDQTADDDACDWLSSGVGSERMASALAICGGPGERCSCTFFVGYHHFDIMVWPVAAPAPRIRTLLPTIPTDLSFWDASGQSVQRCFTRRGGNSHLAHTACPGKVFRVHANDCQSAHDRRGCAAPGAGSL